jgi:hypothetical protein
MLDTVAGTHARFKALLTSPHNMDMVISMAPIALTHCARRRRVESVLKKRPGAANLLNQTSKTLDFNIAQRHSTI